MIPSPSKLMAVPMSLKEANDFVSAYHRHSARTSRDGGKFAIGVSTGEELIGVAIVGNPISASYMDGYTAEVLRVCTSPQAQKGANSFLYACCWRAWRAMGGQRIITYTLTTETGGSLRGAGWKIIHSTKDGHKDWEAKARLTGRARKWQPVYGQQKFCWEQTDGVAP
jgi:hypothetical protein